MKTIFKTSPPLLLREYRLCYNYSGIICYRYIFAHSINEAVYAVHCEEPELEVLSCKLAYLEYII